MGGAFVAGGFGIYNNRVARVDEREKWLRDRKIEGYASYRDVIEGMTFAVNANWMDSMSNSELAAKFAEYAPGKLELVASRELREAAYELEVVLYAYYNTSKGRDTRIQGDHVAMQANLEEVNKKRLQVIGLMQRDLGLEPIEYPMSGSEFDLPRGLAH